MKHKTFYRNMLIGVLSFCMVMYSCQPVETQPSPLIFMSDFSLKDDAVSAMKGVAYSVDNKLTMFDLTHEVPPYDIWLGAQLLAGGAAYWQKGAVFVSVVDPGVGTERKSVVAKTQTGHYFVTPDNGSLTFVAEKMGIAAVREIDENNNRLEGSIESHTFHGRDVYAYTGARLAAGIIAFEEVGPELPPEVVTIAYPKAKLAKVNTIVGNIPMLDRQYGNVWTNIPKAMFDKLNVTYGDTLKVAILEIDTPVYEESIPFVKSFGHVEKGERMIYVNSKLNMAFAVNWGNFAKDYGIQAGPEWRVEMVVE